MIERNLREHLISEKKRMETIIDRMRDRIAKEPEGNIHIVKHGESLQFYLRKGPDDTNGTYLPAAQRNTAIAMIRRKYDKQVMNAACRQLKVIDRFLSAYDPACIRKVYASLSPARRGLVIPAELPDAEYAAAWIAEEYAHKEFPENAPEHYTGRGERVRSKSEVMIADALAQAGIPYRYEYPLYLDSQLIHPDFMILRTADRKEIFWEHFGMMDDGDYSNKAVRRIIMYERNGFRMGRDLIFTIETAQIPLNLAVISSMIRDYCE